MYRLVCQKKFNAQQLCVQCCRIQMSLVKRTQTSDGFRWKCRLCGTAASIRSDSFFFKEWSRDYSQKDIAHEANLGAGATHTIIDWCSFCREVCEQHFIDHPTVIGDLDENCQSKTVEIDESKSFHRKYHRASGEKDTGFSAALNGNLATVFW
jgi:hypothetical protein